MSVARPLLAFSLLLMSGLSLSGCGEPKQFGQDVTGQTGAAAEAYAVCHAEEYKYLIGQPITVVDTLNTGLRTRVLAADSFVPKDYDANRLTFTTSTTDTVSRIFCG